MKERLEGIKERIAAAAARAGRDPASIRLIAVTKTHPPATIARLLELGQMAVGENRPQEMAEKFARLEGKGSWHFIGHLQRNKVGLVLGKAELIHSVDSVRLMEEIQKRAEKSGLVQDVLFEINLGGEGAKTGAREEELPALVTTLARTPNIRLRGLMTVPPYADDPEHSRPYFKRLRELLVALPATSNFTSRELSMGMTNDYEVAIEEGATLVRIGTGLLGTRPATPKLE